MSYADTIKRSWNENRLMSVLVELTYACNLDCTFCYNDTSLDGKPLSLQQYRELLDDLASLGVLNLSLSGGEPLAHPQFFDIAAHARKLGFVIRLKTNGHAMRATMARRVREEVDPFLVEVSIHGATAATHDRQTRVAGSFERLLANIAAMKAVGLRVRVNSVLTRWNEHEISDMLALCDRMGVACQIDSEVKPRDDGDQSPLRIEATPEGQASYRRALLGHANRDADVTEASSAADARQETMRGTDKHCGAGSNTIAIDPFGAVLPCVQWRVPAGNLHESRVTEIWANSGMLREVRDTTRAARRKLEGFGDAGLAANFCPGAAHTYSGDPLSMYPPAEQRMAAGRARVRLTVL